MRAARKRLPGLPDSLDGRTDGNPSGADAAAANACQRHSDQRSRAGTGQVVQSAARLRFPEPRRGDTGYLRAHGDLAPFRNDRAASWSICDGPVRARLEGHDGGRDLSREWLACLVLALAGITF